MPGIDVLLEQIPGGVVARTTTDKTGAFTFENVRRGEYVVRASFAQKAEPGPKAAAGVLVLTIGYTYQSEAATTINTTRSNTFRVATPPGGAPTQYAAELRFSTDGGRVFGKIEWQYPQGLVAGADVSLEGVSGGVVVRTTTDRQGAFSFDKVRRGDYLIRASYQVTQKAEPGPKASANRVLVVSVSYMYQSKATNLNSSKSNVYRTAGPQGAPGAEQYVTEAQFSTDGGRVYGKVEWQY